MLKKNIILGVGITNEEVDTILEHVLKLLKKGEKFSIVTPNPEILVYASKHPEYKKVLNHAEVSLADGVGLFVAGRVLGEPLGERFTGVDFMEKLCEKSAERPMSIGFLGGKPGIAEKAADCLKQKYPWIEVAFTGEEWPTDRADRSNGSYGSDKTGPFMPQTIDILFVAFGAPKQEEWIASNLNKLPVKAAMGVGGAFDYLSGEVRRAPVWIRKMGFEWLFRLITQPWRWRRQLALVEFMWLVYKQALLKAKS